MEDKASSSDLPDPDLKIILLGDSAVGKSKLVERYLMNDFNPRQLSTFALTLFRKDVKLEDSSESVTVGMNNCFALVTKTMID